MGMRSWKSRSCSVCQDPAAAIGRWHHETVSGDGSRILAIGPEPETQARSVTVVVNWTGLLKIVAGWMIALSNGGPMRSTVCILGLILIGAASAPVSRARAEPVVYIGTYTASAAKASMPFGSTTAPAR